VYSRWFDFYNHRLRCLRRRQGSLKLGLNSKEGFQRKDAAVALGDPNPIVVPTPAAAVGRPACPADARANWLQKAGSTENSSARRLFRANLNWHCPLRIRAHSPAENVLYRTFTARRPGDRSHNQFQLLPIRLPCSNRCNIFLRSEVYKRRTSGRTSVLFRLPFDFSS
jgi:hypothetical protein